MPASELRSPARTVGAAVAMAGATVALSIGVPAGTLLGGAAGWRLAQSLLVTCWNLGIATAAATGGLLLAHTGPISLSWTALALLAAALTVTAGAHHHGFPLRNSRPR
ncbi:hypothetical protein ACIBCA_25115 [Kitasatospora sp. NPDC051170]|uniref:hypothetical protein n=1 Tax=Kitasatospora sp. NPDC051170 TaxID=3364056 RepID=UPI003788A5D9